MKKKVPKRIFILSLTLQNMEWYHLTKEKRLKGEEAAFSVLRK
jgi:hypothetical protein